MSRPPKPSETRPAQRTDSVFAGTVAPGLLQSHPRASGREQGEEAKRLTHLCTLGLIDGGVLREIRRTLSLPRVFPEKPG